MCEFIMNLLTKICESICSLGWDEIGTIVKKAYSYKPLFAFIDKNDPSCFVLRCLTINKSYRCKAAHSGNVSYDDALDCCYEIYGEASGHIEAKKQSAEIISLLRELFTILE